MANVLRNFKTSMAEREGAKRRVMEVRLESKGGDDGIMSSLISP